MTRKKALQILMENAAENVRGQGCGIRPAHSEQKSALVRDAIIRLWKEAYSWDIRSADLFNIGLLGIVEE